MSFQISYNSGYSRELKALIESTNYAKPRTVPVIELRNMDLRPCIISTKKVCKLYLTPYDIDSSCSTLGITRGKIVNTLC
jgi:hypothetical protein